MAEIEGAMGRVAEEEVGELTEAWWYRTLKLDIRT